jgi:NitT/TauT family transport system permease protein
VSSVRRAVSYLAPPVGLFVAFLIVWEIFVRVRDIQPFLLPKPTSIWTQFTGQTSNIWDATKATGSNALVGLVCGIVLGTVFAIVSSRFRVLREMTTPVAAALNATPIIAISPVLNNMIVDGSISSTPRRIVVTVLVFFPIFINVMKGLTQSDPIHRELMRSYAASETSFLQKVRVPNALGFFFTGFKIAAPVCVIAAVVAEYFGGPQNGLGTRISSNAAQTKTELAWAYVFAASVLGIVFFAISNLLERFAVPWRNRRVAGS